MMIHPTAIIDPKAQIDSTVEIGPYCTIGAQVKINAHTKLISHVVLQGDTEIGEKNTIFPFSVIGSVPQDLKYRGENTQVRIGDNNTIRENVTIHLGTVQGGNVTRVKNNCLLMAYTHLGHDTEVGNGCILSNYSGLAGHVILEDYVTLGGMVGIAQYIRVGKHAYLSAQSGVDRDVPPFVIAIGARPCVIKGINIVGLRRRNLSVETIQHLNEAIKLWMRPGIFKDQCLLEIDVAYGSIPEVQELIQFIRSHDGVTR
jgi:UDP-N-acetylglucosamine acyltransferase